MDEHVPEGEAPKAPSADRLILAAVTRRGRRLLTHAELVAEGLSAKEIEVRAGRGTIQRIHHEVYLAGAGALTSEEKLQAGVLAGGETAAVAHFSAAALWGLGNYDPDSVHIVVGYKTSLAATGVTAHRTRRIVPTQIRQGVRVVCVEEALLHLAARMPTRTVHRDLTTAWRKQLTTPSKVLTHLDLHGGKGVRGLTRLRGIAELYVEHGRGPGSEAEADFLFELKHALDAAGIEHPELQKVIDLGRGMKAAPDCVWPVRWKVVEVMGLAAHGNYEVQADDVERAAAIRAAGWDLEEVTPRQLRERRDKTIARIVRFLQTPNRRWPSVS